MKIPHLHKRTFLNSAHHEDTPHTSFKLAVLVNAIIIVPLFLIGAFGYLSTRTAITDELASRLALRAEIDRAQIQRAIEKYEQQVRYATESNSLEDAVLALRAGDSGAQERINRFFEAQFRGDENIISILLASGNGMVLASTDDDLVNTSIASSMAFAIGRETATFVGLMKNDADQLNAIAAGPIIRNGQLLGVVEIIFSTKPISTVTNDYTGLGETGEVILVQQNAEGDAVFLTPLRYDARAAINRGLSGDERDRVCVVAASGIEDAFPNGDMRDYRDQNVVAATRYISSLGWGIVVKMDADEALFYLNTVLYSLILMFGLSVAVVTVGLHFFFEWQRTTLVRGMRSRDIVRDIQ